MLTLLVANWKYVVIAAQGVALAFVWVLLQHSEDEFAAYKARAEAKAEVARAVADAAEQRHKQTVEDVSNAWNDQLPGVRAEAVERYIAAHGGGAGVQPAGNCVLYKPPSAGSAHAVGPGDADGPRSQCVPDSAFIADCAEDALKVGAWQMWARQNSLPVVGVSAPENAPDLDPSVASAAASH